MTDQPINGTPPSNPLAPLLGAHWQITPFSWSWINATGPQGAINLLTIESPVGRLAFGLNDHDLGAFIRTAQQHHTGIVLPGPGPIGGLL